MVGSGLADRLADSLPRCEHVSSFVLLVRSCCSLRYGCHDKDRRCLSPGRGPRVLAIFSIHCFQNHGLVLPTCSLSASQSAEHLHETGLEARATTPYRPRPNRSVHAEADVLVSLQSRTKCSDSVSVMASKILPICNRKCFRFQVWSQKIAAHLPTSPTFASRRWVAQQRPRPRTHGHAKRCCCCRRHPGYH